MNGTIYVITNIINDKKYVGMTTRGSETRFEEHISKALNGTDTVFYNDIRKHGRENFKVDVLETGLPNDLKILGEREKYWIKELGTFYELGNGYNFTLGGIGSLGIVWSEERREYFKRKVFTEDVRRKMSEANTGEKNPFYGKGYLISGEKNPFYGRKHSEESRKKMSENHPDFSGEKNPMYGRSGENSPNWGKGKPMILISPDGSKKEFGSVGRAAEYLDEALGNCSTGDGIRGLLKGWVPKRGQLVGYSAMYLEDIEEIS